MRGAIPVARLAGIRVTVDPTWFIIFLLVAYSLAVGYLPQQLAAVSPGVRWALAAALALLLFVSVLAHEMAHALVARARAVNVDEIMLFIFGGVAKLRDEPRDAKSEFLIAAAGPALSIAVGAALLGVENLLRLPEVVAVGLWWLGFINVALAIFNLVPGFPLDGGRILRAILWWRTGDFERATVGAARTGKVIAALLMGLGLLLALSTGNLSWLWEVVIGWFLWTAASHSIRVARLRDAVLGVTVRDIMTERVPAIRADQDVRVALAQTSAYEDHAQVAVIEPDGTLVGVVRRDALRAAAEDDPGREARAVAESADQDQVFAPETPAEDVIARLAGGGGLPLVVDRGRLVGTVDPRALLAALRRTEEGGPPAGSA
ncbi:MAG: site-2 protease family protein [Gemmatimonadota bacterium]